jgi:hypothetical protein
MGIRGEHHPSRGKQQASANSQRGHDVFHLCTPFQDDVADWRYWWEKSVGPSERSSVGVNAKSDNPASKPD